MATGSNRSAGIYVVGEGRAGDARAGGRRTRAGISKATRLLKNHGGGGVVDGGETGKIAAQFRRRGRGVKLGRGASVVDNVIVVEEEEKPSGG